MIMEGGDAELVTAWSSKVRMWHNTKAHMTDTKSFSGKLFWAVKRGLKDCRRCTSRGSRGQSRVGEEWTNAMNFQAVVWCLIMFSTPIYSNLVILGVISFEPHPFVKASCSCSSTRLCIQSDSWQVTEEQCEQPASRDVKFCGTGDFPSSLPSLYCTFCFPIAAQARQFQHVPINPNRTVVL